MIGKYFLDLTLGVEAVVAVLEGREGIGVFSVGDTGDSHGLGNLLHNLVLRGLDILFGDAGVFAFRSTSGGGCILLFMKFVCFLLLLVQRNGG